MTIIYSMAPRRVHHVLRMLPRAIVLAWAGFAFGASAALADEPAPDPLALEDDALPPGLKTHTQGPAISAPREIFNMLEQRKRFLDKREAALRGADTRLLELRAELEQIVTRHEKLVEAEKKRHQAASEAEKSKDAKNAGSPRNVNQAQLAKIYEAMPAEEAAARLERMPERKALEVLRLLKGKSAGAILAEVKPDRAARLTEQLLGHP
jgi:flagellar motility protein MotE (MotC chaperone)